MLQHEQQPASDTQAQPDDVEVRDLLTRMGDRWSMTVLALLVSGPRRFSELRRATSGISRRMLALTLKRLQRDGIVARTVLPSIPPRVDYHITPLGQTLLELMLALASWAERNRLHIREARDRFDRDHEWRRRAP